MEGKTWKTLDSTSPGVRGGMSVCALHGVGGRVGPFVVGGASLLRHTCVCVCVCVSARLRLFPSLRLRRSYLSFVGDNMSGIADYLKKRDLDRQRAAVFDKSGLPVMNAAAIKLSCMEHNGYETPSLNDKLYLHFRGYRKIENLDEYTNCKTLFLESNGLGKIENLSHMTGMRSLYMHQNVISSIGDGLKCLTELTTLNLSQNRIKKVDGLETLTTLSTLNLAKNVLATSEDLEGLLACPSITNLDLSGNNIDDETVIDSVLKKLPKLSALYLKGNPAVRKIKHYRKTLLSKMPRLAYLDDRPVFEIERAAVTAWAEGGIEAERAARKNFQTAKVDKDRQSMQNFRRWKQERKEARMAEIEKLKAEGKPIPAPRKYVSYRNLTDAEQDQNDQIRSAIARAENAVGTEDLTVLGREYWKNEGCPVFDEEGNPIVEPQEKTSTSAEASTPVDPFNKKEENAPIMLVRESSKGKKASQKADISAPPPAPHTAAAVAPPMPPPSTVASEDNASKEEQKEESDRQQRIADSLKMYQQQRKTAKESKPPSSSVFTENWDSRSGLRSAGREAGTRPVVSDESDDLTPEEREKLAQAVAEADEEEDNYRSARSRMKNQAREASKRASGWNNVLDDKLKVAVIESYFDFDAVATTLGRSSEECRLRYALLDMKKNGGSSAPSRPKKAPSSSAQTAGMKENKNPTPSLDAAKRPPTRFPPRAATNAADPFASFAAASSGVSKITVDFSKLPSMGSDSDESDEDADESGVSKSPIRSSDVHQEIFGVPRTVPNAKHSVVLTTEPTDVDGLD